MPFCRWRCVTAMTDFAAAAAEASAVGTFITRMASFSRSSSSGSSAAAYRASSASPTMSAGLARDQIGGSAASRRAIVCGEMAASSPPRSTSRSTASTPMPPPLVKIASRLPDMLVK
jgi:hypothetical protein